MRVRVYPADPWGCGHYRLIWPARALRDQGHDVEVGALGASDDLTGTVVDGHLVTVALGSDADVVVLQRPTNQLVVDLVYLLRKRGTTVVVDMDDDLTCVHPRNPAFRLLHPRWSPTNNWRHAERACQLASLVTVSTPELQRHYGTRRSRVLRNCVPRRFLDLRPPTDVEPVWGWAGALHSHPDDLPLLGSAVHELRRRGHEFTVVGRSEGTGRALGLREDPPGTGHVEFEAWGTALTTLAVGAAPLADTRFNRAKSWLKPLEYAACGVPWVGSDRAEYRELRALGAGFLVGDRTRDWVRVVDRLLSDDRFRHEVSESCRAVAARLTVEEHAWRWLETWEAACHLDRGRTTVGRR